MGFWLITMEEIGLEVDGKAVSGQNGSTILEICQKNDIYIPTLCHLEGLTSYGGCRLCLVEVKDQGMVPGCTTPVSDGMKIKTRGRKLADYRKTILELLLSERNHFCFMCEKSGDCELQSLCYEFGIDHSRFPPAFPSLAVDTSVGDMVVDNNRCILCGRCIRVCSEIIGNNTLGFINRGSDTVIDEPDLLPLEESNCVKCGACIEVCPTGAIFGTLSSYRGREEECEVLTTTCQECPMACKLKVFVKDQNIIKVCGGGLGERYGGQLCEKGRFHLLLDSGSRIQNPSINKDGRKLDCDMSTAIARAAKGLSRWSGNSGQLAIIASPRCTNETFKKLAELSIELGASKIILLEPCLSVLSWKIMEDERKGDTVSGFGIEDISSADTILLLGLGPDEPHQIIASEIRKALNHGGSLVSIGRMEHVLTERADLDIRLLEGDFAGLMDCLAPVVEFARTGKVSEAEKAASRTARCSGLSVEDIFALTEYLKAGSRVAVIAGQEIECDRALLKSIVRLAASFRESEEEDTPIIWLRQGGNAAGALSYLGGLGVKGTPVDVSSIRAAYALLADDDAKKMKRLGLDPDFLVYHGSFESELSQDADVVIPSKTWCTRSGTVFDLDGKKRIISPVVDDFADDVPQDDRVLERLKEMLVSDQTERGKID